MSERLWTVCELDYFPRNIRMRSLSTREQYRFAISDLERFCGRPPTLDDLNDDVFVRFLLWLVEVRGLAEVTANERAGRIKSLWNWLAKRGKVPVFPTIERLAVPEQSPLAWSEAELRTLFAAAAKMQGTVGPFQAAAWWGCLLSWLWCTGERIGATLDMQWQHVDLERGVACLPARIRKQRLKAAVYQLWPPVVTMLRTLYRADGEARVFPWTKSRCTYWLHWNTLLAIAGLPGGRRRKSHAIRVSYATWTAAFGGDATAKLMHSNPGTTARSYIDQRFIPDRGVKLFRPWEPPEPMP
jgi:integrase